MNSCRDDMDDIIERLRILWHKWPSMRLGQLIMNYWEERVSGRSLYFVEDEEMIGKLEQWYESLGRGGSIND